MADEDGAENKDDVWEGRSKPYFGQTDTTPTSWYDIGKLASGEEWEFRQAYKNRLTGVPISAWHDGAIKPFQNIIKDGARQVRDNMLKRQETFGVAYALLLGCALSVLGSIQNQQADGSRCFKPAYRSQCDIHQGLSGMSICFSVMMELIVLNNISFISTCSTAHVAYVIDAYGFFFQWPATLPGICLSLVPLMGSVAMTISVNMHERHYGAHYWPSVLVYTVVAIALMMIVCQYKVFRTIKLEAMMDRASVHFPELDFDVAFWETPKEKSPEKVGLLEDEATNPVSTDATLEVKTPGGSPRLADGAGSEINKQGTGSIEN